MLRKKFAVLVLLVAATAVPSSAAPAFADGPKNDQEAAVCSQLLGSVLPGLVPTQEVCTVNTEKQDSTGHVQGWDGSGLFGG
ncbi:hypothetical protein [Kitasatospora terrestris]|uniref:Secreted protein n=1 Tax=Kitasatospora terrestris TaxID=258051 RepID=A0ABP9DQA2_9ACTN